MLKWKCTALAEDEGAEDSPNKKTAKVPGEKQHRSSNSSSPSLHPQSGDIRSDPLVQAAARLSQS